MKEVRQNERIRKKMVNDGCALLIKAPPRSKATTERRTCYQDDHQNWPGAVTFSFVSSHQRPTGEKWNNIIKDHTTTFPTHLPPDNQAKGLDAKRTNAASRQGRLFDHRALRCIPIPIWEACFTDSPANFVSNCSSRLLDKGLMARKRPRSRSIR